MVTPRTAALGVALLALLAAGAVTVGGPGLLAPGEDAYERTTVTVVDEDGTTLATVEVRVADTFRKRYVGLSDTASLAPGEGMLFVHDEEGRYSYVMRDMAFPLDIVFVAADGTVTTVHHAPVPPPGTPDDELTPYRGRAKYVLEVPRGYANGTGIGPGDSVRIEGRPTAG